MTILKTSEVDYIISFLPSFFEKSVSILLSFFTVTIIIINCFQLSRWSLEFLRPTSLFNPPRIMGTTLEIKGTFQHYVLHIVLYLSPGDVDGIRKCSETWPFSTVVACFTMGSTEVSAA